MSTKPDTVPFDLFTESARRSIAQAIRDAGGNEVLAVGRFDGDRLIHEIIVAARGNRSSVPALLPFMERGDVVIHNHPSGRLSPSDADLAVASFLGNQGIGFCIVNNMATDVYVVAEPVRQTVRSTLDMGALVSVFAAGGKLSRLHPTYETRSGQIDMLEAVIRGLNDELVVVVEAGTGVGKSLAYLVPAMEWAIRNDERVVVSTATINLQQQLIEQDIPIASRLVEGEVKAALVKGRGNYVCIRRLAEALQENVLFEEEDEELSAIRAWTEASPTGSRSDLPFSPRGEVWARVCAEADGCLGLRCPSRSDCFVLKARREAAEARILVTNHHLLFSDLSLRQAGMGYDGTAVLPPFSRLVFDEAHNIERSATSFFSLSLSDYPLRRSLGILHRERRGRSAGVILRLMRYDGAAAHRLTAIPDLVRQALAAFEDLSATAGRFIDTRAVRFTERTPSALDESVAEGLQLVQGYLLGILSVLDSFFAAQGDEALEDDDVVAEARIASRRIQELVVVAERFRHREDYPDQVFWVERLRARDGSTTLRFVTTPLDVTDLMRDAVFGRYATVVCTSATLTVGGSFDFWAGRTGLSGLRDREVEYLSVPSPFPYDKNVLLAVPADAPDPNSPQYQPYLSEGVRSILELSEGRALVLFTSYAMLSETYAAIAPSMSARGISVLKQGDGDRAKLLREFNADISSVLLATDSFWEGVDAPGDSLGVVIICRLPFKVPSDPVIEARMEFIARGGGDPFLGFSVPEAVMRLKQGFGRLMRRSTDRGAVVLFDNRVVRKAYGRHFFDSLPVTRTSIKDMRLLMTDLEAFLYPAPSD